MGKILESLFRKAGRTYGTSKWIFKSFAGNEKEALQAEYSLGKMLSGEIIKQIGLVNDPTIASIIQEIADRLYDHLTNKNRKFVYYILKSPEINAFALPGGFIFLTSSLLNLLKDKKDELAFVLGHEMGHVIKGHALDRMVANTAIGIISKIGPGRGVVGGFTRKTLAKLLYSAYSQDQESEADDFGVSIMRAAGFDPHAAQSFLLQLNELKPPKVETTINRYLASHPPLKVRVRNIQKTINQTSG